MSSSSNSSSSGAGSSTISTTSTTTTTATASSEPPKRGSQTRPSPQNRQRPFASPSSSSFASSSSSSSSPVARDSTNATGRKATNSYRSSSGSGSGSGNSSGNRNPRPTTTGTTTTKPTTATTKTTVVTKEALASFAAADPIAASGKGCDDDKASSTGATIGSSSVSSSGSSSSSRAPPRSRGPSSSSSYRQSPSSSSTSSSRPAPSKLSSPSSSASRPPTKQLTTKPKQAVDNRDLVARLTEQLSQSNYECMVCYERISRRVSVWNCSTCFAVFHLHCIQQWARKSTQPSSTPASSSSHGWRCPGCQTIASNVPSRYYCFCGKEENPPWNNFITPHSCGNSCGRLRAGTTCPHPCVLRCHPGPCPPCALQSPTRSCFCGKQSYQTRCGAPDDGQSCGGECGRKLSCGKHACSQVCHSGACPPCSVSKELPCYCGKVCKPVACGAEAPNSIVGRMAAPDSEEKEKKNDDDDDDKERNLQPLGFFTCNQPCDRLLACEKHHCEQPCHKGECSPCPRLPSLVTTCPCGKTPIADIAPAPRTSCEDDIPCCGNVCGKRLQCFGGGKHGTHRCESPCHLGPCPPCEKEITIVCRCGYSKKQIRCHELTKPAEEENFTCERICRQLRSCGRHQCARQCCPASNIPSKENSGDWHRCELVCNKKLQCGLHHCQDLCHKGYCKNCLQSSFDELACHCGRVRLFPPIPCGTKLPPCPNLCAREHPCAHPVTHSCHDDDVSCPPCTVLVMATCQCHRHMPTSALCYRVVQNLEVSCGRPCQLPRKDCGHACSRACHTGPCHMQQVVDKATGETTETAAACDAICGKKRVNCNHTCKQRCHFGSRCPDVICQEEVRIICPCGFRSETVLCSVNNSLLSPPSLSCNVDCEINQRNMRLAEALQIDPNRLKPQQGPRVEFKQFCFEYGLQNPGFVKKVEAAFESLFQDPNKRVYAFPPMKREQRMFIHELCEAYNMKSQSFDAEPNRSISATWQPESRIPHPPLSTMLLDGSWKSVYQPDISVLANRPPTSTSFGPLFSRPMNAVLLDGLKLEVDMKALRSMLEESLHTRSFDLARLNDSQVAIFPDTSNEDSLILADGKLLQFKEILKEQLGDTLTSICCAWVTANLEVRDREDGMTINKDAASRRQEASMQTKLEPKPIETAKNIFSVLGTDVSDANDDDNINDSVGRRDRRQQAHSSGSSSTVAVDVAGSHKSSSSPDDHLETDAWEDD